MKPLSTILLVGAAASQLGSTDCGSALRDTGFDLWCGDTLCAWTIERGSLQRVATWNEGDSGVELVGNDVAISQLSPVNSADGTCLEFDLVANVDIDADVELTFDLDADGSIDHVERIPTASWRPVSFKIPFTGVFSGVRFVITKVGPGKAVLANLGARIADGCEGLPKVVTPPATLGSPCKAAADCVSGICGLSPTGAPVPFTIDPGTVCLGCDDTHPCASGATCGLLEQYQRDLTPSPYETYDEVMAPPVTAAQVSCVAAESRSLGQPCITDAECVLSFAFIPSTPGFCTEGTCSTCRTSADCANGESCGAWPNPATGGTWTFVCAQGQHVRASDEPCSGDADCASGTCAGEELDELRAPKNGHLQPCDVDDRPECFFAMAMQCPDGRECLTAADCPFGMGSDDGLQNGPCLTLGVLGGYCK